ncbi:2403_t:CDS:2, partial [Gigaspora rosea]
VIYLYSSGEEISHLYNALKTYKVFSGIYVIGFAKGIDFIMVPYPEPWTSTQTNGLICVNLKYSFHGAPEAMNKPEYSPKNVITMLKTVDVNQANINDIMDNKSERFIYLALKFLQQCLNERKTPSRKFMIPFSLQK